jgi:uncharacterized protein YidB (DUF937 family)
MGLIDILSGMQQGPHGQRAPASSAGVGAGGGGMSPIMMALLGLLAYKGLQGGSPQATVQARPTQPPPGGAGTAGKPGGGLDDLLGGLFGGKPPASAGAKPGGSLADMLPGGLGSLLGGATAGGMLSGGLGSIIKELQDSGHGEAAQSWVGKGPNDDIAPGDLASALGGDTIDALSRQAGIGRDDLLQGLRQYLPQLVDQLTPDGRLPTPEETRRMI